MEAFSRRGESGERGWKVRSGILSRTRCSSKLGIWADGEDSAIAGGGAVADGAGVGKAGAREADCRCDPACELPKKLRMSPLRGIVICVMVQSWKVRFSRF